jgi:hypothetical protein
MRTIKKVIEKMGYSNSSNLCLYDDIKNKKELSIHSLRLLNNIRPYAVYFVDKSPFILFFELSQSNDIQHITRLVWNAQIPVAIICTNDTIKIFNGYFLEENMLKKISELSVDDCNEYSPFSYWKISNPLFWDSYLSQYSSQKLSEVLLKNITFLTDKLRSKYEINFSTRIILRLIFIRYLIDRGVDLDYENLSSNIEQSKKAFLLIVKDKERLYDLFIHLKDKFNGNLFDLGNEINDNNLKDEVFILLADFLSGNISLPESQRSLFDLYDFNIIPVELISNIYEILLGKETQNQDEAFYTPNYLVEYILDQTISPFLENKNQFTILDPSCGSGIFLVNSYRRIVEKHLHGKQYSTNNKMLINLLRKNIYGIDTNKDAIDVAIFSLYLTVLDYKDPKTLVKFSLPNIKDTNLFESDFFNEQKLKNLEEIKFDFIIGNPPWGNKSGLHMEYCRTRGHKHRQQNNEICRSFVFRVKDFSKDTQCCFILHSKLLYNQKRPALEFRRYLLENTCIDKIVELSSVRELIFKNAKGPAVIIMFKYTENNYYNNRMTYISLKPNIFFKLFNIIMIEKNDIKYIAQDFLVRFDWAWKTSVFGLTGDIDNIIYLQEKYKKISEVIKTEFSNYYSAGIKYADGDQKDASHLVDLPLVGAKNAIEHFCINLSDTTVFEKRKIDRPRDKMKELFDPPGCLINKWIDGSNYTIYSSVSDKKIVYTDSVYIIKGFAKQRKELLNLVGLYNSSLFGYLNLMLGSSVGIERNQCFMNEIISFPYIYDEEIVTQVEYIQKMNKEFSLENSVNVKREYEKLNKLIFKDFNLLDNIFIDYALKIQIPQLTNYNSKDANRKVANGDLMKYCKCFDEYFSPIYEKSNKYISITFYNNVVNRFTVFELKICNLRPFDKINFSQSDDGSKEFLTKFSVYKTNDLFYKLYDVVYFQKSSFFIIKTNQYKNWHPAIAQLDLMDVIDQIFTEKGE